MFSGSISVLGAGSWGTALAVSLSRNFDAVFLWGRNNQALQEMAASRVNTRYLPDIRIPDNVIVTSSLADTLDEPCRLVLAVPSQSFRPTIRLLKEAIANEGQTTRAVTVAWASKGFEHASGKLLGEVCREELPDARQGVISGPSFARETAAGLPTALTMACDSIKEATELACWFRTDSTRVYYSNDVVGVQLGSAIKNVIAIAAGISDGLGYGANARAALITRGLFELNRLGISLGGRAETFMGLTGVGDLILTCTDNQSRNRRFGLGIGQGKSSIQVQKEIGQEIEGINTVAALHEMALTRHVEMPITHQVFHIVHENADPAQAVTALLSRNPKAESLSWNNLSG